jgi:hypothetical protein
LEKEGIYPAYTGCLYSVNFKTTKHYACSYGRDKKYLLGKPFGKCPIGKPLRDGTK